MNETTTTTEKTKPVHKVRLGQIAVSVWQNIDDDGKPNYRATISKSYRDFRGLWQETGSLRSDDLVILGKLLQHVSDWMLGIENG